MKPCFRLKAGFFQTEQTLLYGVSTADKFFVDGAWLNAGETNLSPYAPQNGFADPNPVPIPGAVWLLGSGLIVLFAIRRKLRN